MIAWPGLAIPAREYDGYIVDLWGVIHDGVTPFAAALDCLAALRAEDRRVVLLSNAPRRAAAVIDSLRHLGIADTLYDAVMTSGEAAHHALATRPDPWFRALGPRLYHLGPPRDRNVFADLGLTQVDTPASADFVLNTGPDDERSPTDPAAFDDVLAACCAAGLPMLCANPDLYVVRDGQRVLCAGFLAERYAASGASVRSLGKPDPAIYDDVMELLRLPRSRVLAIGDSLRTDIAGAAAANIDALWITGGIHAADDPADAAGHAPVARMLHLVW